MLLESQRERKPQYRTPPPKKANHLISIAATPLWKHCAPILIHETCNRPAWLPFCHRPGVFSASPDQIPGRKLSRLKTANAGLPPLWACDIMILRSFVFILLYHWPAAISSLWQRAFVCLPAPIRASLPPVSPSRIAGVSVPGQPPRVSSAAVRKVSQIPSGPGMRSESLPCLPYAGSA